MSGKGRGEEGIWEEGMQRAGAPSSFLLFIERRKRRPDDASKERLKRPRSGRHTVCLLVVFSFSFVSFFLLLFFLFFSFLSSFFFSQRRFSCTRGVCFSSSFHSSSSRCKRTAELSFICMYIYICIYVCIMPLIQAWLWQSSFSFCSFRRFALFYITKYLYHVIRIHCIYLAKWLFY